MYHTWKNNKGTYGYPERQQDCRLLWLQLDKKIQRSVDNQAFHLWPLIKVAFLIKHRSNKRCKFSKILRKVFYLKIYNFN